MYLPFLDHLVTEINEKLVVPLPSFQAQLLIPGKWHCIGYKNFVDHVHLITQWFSTSLDAANAAFYHWGIYVAVKTLLAYPVSACAAERSFSSMKRLKTPLRNTMTDHRLSSLAILPTHKEKEINGESVLDQFAQNKERRLALCL